eukprot:1193577-Prorocentrum_minimum.AAC.3
MLRWSQTRTARRAFIRPPFVDNSEHTAQVTCTCPGKAVPLSPSSVCTSWCFSELSGSLRALPPPGPGGRGVVLPRVHAPAGAGRRGLPHPRHPHVPAALRPRAPQQRRRALQEGGPSRPHRRERRYVIGPRYRNMPPPLTR